MRIVLRVLREDITVVVLSFRSLTPLGLALASNAVPMGLSGVTRFSVGTLSPVDRASRLQQGPYLPV
jgi:hypothetical protein